MSAAEIFLGSSSNALARGLLALGAEGGEPIVSTLLPLVERVRVVTTEQHSRRTTSRMKGPL